MGKQMHSFSFSERWYLLNHAAKAVYYRNDVTAKAFIAIWAAMQVIRLPLFS